MQEFETGAVRDTGGKGRMDLLPWCALIRVSRHMEDALTHYPERNWEKGLPMHSMVDSAFRHLAKYVDGQTDEDHLCAAATNLLMAMWMEERRPDSQDIPTRFEVVDNGDGSYTKRPILNEMPSSLHEKASSLASNTQEVHKPTPTQRGQGRANGTQESVYPIGVTVPPCKRYNYGNS